MGAASQFRGQMETLVKSTLEDAKRDKEIALETLRMESSKLAAEKEISLEKTLRAECDQELQRIRDTEFTARTELTARLEAEFQERLQGVEERHEAVLAELQTKNDEVCVMFTSYHTLYHTISNTFSSASLILTPIILQYIFNISSKTPFNTPPKTPSNTSPINAPSTAPLTGHAGKGRTNARRTHRTVHLPCHPGGVTQTTSRTTNRKSKNNSGGDDPRASARMDLEVGSEATGDDPSGR